jgi:hypothetical protein
MTEEAGKMHVRIVGENAPERMRGNPSNPEVRVSRTRSVLRPGAIVRRRTRERRER